MNRYDSPTFADVIREGIENRMRELRIAEPVEVREFDATTQTVTVRPLVLRGLKDDDGEYVLETPPDIHDVPVQWPRSSSGGMTFPIAVGDTGQIVCSIRDISQWRYTGQRGSPGDHRPMTLAGAVFQPGLFDNAHPVPDFDPDHVVVYTTGAARLKLGGAGATKKVAYADDVELEFAKVRAALSSVAGNAGAGGSELTGSNTYTTVASLGSSKVRVL